MLSWFGSETRLRRKAKDFYGASVTRARSADFYRSGCVPDTPEGRYEMIVLHVFLLADRLNRTSAEGARLALYVSEAFVGDMDDSMREMGVGDLTVPKKVKKAAAGLMERATAYRAALGGDDDAGLARLLTSNLPSLQVPCAARIAGYIRRQHAHLQRLDFDRLMSTDAPFDIAALEPAP